MIYISQAYAILRCYLDLPLVFSKPYNMYNKPRNLQGKSENHWKLALVRAIWMLNDFKASHFNEMTSNINITLKMFLTIFGKK